MTAPPRSRSGVSQPRSDARRPPPSAAPRGTRLACVAALACAVALAAGARIAPARAQDFDPVMPSALAPGAASLLDDGLPGGRDGVQLAAAVTRWFGLEALETRHVALAAGWRGARAALGLSQTGDPEVGWTTLGLAAGGSSPAAGAALRALARRDRAAPGLPGPPGDGAGFEVGGGAWARAAPALVLHASAPQILVAGEAPPLARGLELGGTLRLQGGALWLRVRSAPRGAPWPPDHEAGIALDLAAGRAWVFARDRPLRAGAGLETSARGIAVAVAFESHPVLGATTRLALALGRAP